MNAAERSRINRANGAKSRGPQSETTKAISSRNALKHGLCAAKHPLPNEDPDEVREETLRWTTHYRPRTEHHLELVGRIASACTLQRRCGRAYDATVALQVLNAEADIEQAHEAEVAAFQARLVEEPTAAVAGLRRTALGCRWLMGRWGRLRDHLEAYGSLANPDCEEMIRLCGIAPINERAPRPEFFEIWLHCELARPGAHAYALQNVPEGLRASYQQRWKDPEANRQELLGRIDAALAELTAREAQLRTGREAVERATAEDRALVITEPNQARLWLRYYSESNSAFFRASRELEESLAEDEGGATLCDAPGPRNEPNDPVGASLSEDIAECCGASAAVSSECQVAGRSERDRGGADFPITPPVPAAEPTTKAANNPSRNEPNGPSEEDLTEESVDVYALKALIASSPLAAAIWERTLRLRRPINDPVERERLIGEQERDLAAWEEEIRRMEKLVG